MKLYVAINDERSHEEFLNGLELRAFLTEESAEQFITSQLGLANGDDWIVGVLDVAGAAADTIMVTLTLTQAQIDEIKQAILSQEPGKLELLSAAPSPWVVGNGACNQFRAMDGGQIVWTTDVNEALQFARRKDAESFAEEDEDAWQIVQVNQAIKKEKPE